MKKIVAVLLAVVMCMALVACGAGKTDVTGEWKDEAHNSTLVLNEDGTGTIIEENWEAALTWEYDDDSNTFLFTLTENGAMEQGTFMEDSEKIIVDSLVYTRAE